MENIKDEITNIAINMGAKKIGFAKLTDYIPEKYSHLDTGISFIVRLSDQIIDDIEGIPTYTYYHHYRTVNYLIDQIAFKISDYLQDKGYLSMPIPASQSVKTKNEKYSGIFQHRTVATLSGNGWIGKNASLITKEFGPRVRLGTVLTNWKTQYNSPIKESKCGDCRICVSKCPALALKGNNWSQGLLRKEIVDVVKCSNHMSNHYKNIGRGSVCGVCISSCPVGNERIR